jgi:uncharacterized membrane protein YccC
MNRLPAWTKLRRLAEQESLQPDLGRAIRATLAFMVPLLLAVAGWLPIEVTFVAIAAQNIAMVDVRGAYRLRFALLLAMTAVFVGAAALGTLTSEHLVLALLATALVAGCGGLWRHLSSDYGMSLAISSTLVFLIALNSPGGAASIGNHSLAALVGGLWGVTLQIANWPFRPQHPLRRSISDSWLAVADLFVAMAPTEPAGATLRLKRTLEAETTLRTTLDKGYADLAVARPGLLRERLETLNLAAARLATRVVALNTALEALMSERDFTLLAPALQPAFTSLTNTSRTVALAVVSRQPAHLAATEVRLRRLANLLQVLQARIAATAPTAAGGQLAEILRQIGQHLPAIHDALRATVDRADEHGAFSLELLDVETWSLRPLASALNLTTRVDPALARFVFRVAVLLMVGVVAFKTLGLPHGYWLPFTVIVVLQPDYGSTRRRAAQRLAGTFFGSAFASLLLWLHLPFAALAMATAATIFTFGYLVKRHYARAVFFITLFIVLLTESSGPVTIEFTLERLGSTAAGGALALLAAMFFWPVWERDRFPPILAAALRANRDFLRLLVTRLADGDSYDSTAIAAKRRAETANSLVFSSLQRMTGDPKNQQEGLEQAATLANGNQRLTRALTVLALHLTAGAPLRRPEVKQFAQLADETLETLARTVEGGAPEASGPLLAALENFSPRAPDGAAPQEPWVFAQFTHAATELSAMMLAASPPPLPIPRATSAVA